MSKPWQAEHVITEQQALKIVAEQFPKLHAKTIKAFGVGWDNTVFLINDCYVFRFPRRQVAVTCLQNEITVLPIIAETMPFSMTAPEYIGEAGIDFPWPFAGYQLLPGKTASLAALDDSQRSSNTQQLAEFLRALHGFDVEAYPQVKTITDDIARLDVANRTKSLVERFSILKQYDLWQDITALEKLIVTAQTLTKIQPMPSCLVHGDLYSRHLIVDAQAKLTGFIDWGDVHYGNPAIDIAIAHIFLPPTMHDKFRRHYGDIHEDTWALARFRALYSAVTLLVYGHDIESEELIKDSQITLSYLTR